MERDLRAFGGVVEARGARLDRMDALYKGPLRVYMEELNELTAALDPDARRQLLGENVARLYGPA